jgi:hypothetical protein
MLPRTSSGRGRRRIVRPFALVGWLVIGLLLGEEWPTLTDFFRASMRPLLGRIVLFGLWLWLGWHLFVRDWTIVSGG